MSEKIVLFEADIDTNQAIKDTLKLKESLEFLKNAAEQAKEKNGELSAEYLKYKAAIQATQAEIKTQENLTKKLALSESELAGTIPKLEAANAKLRQEQRGLNLESEAGLKRNKEINDNINRNTDFIKKNSDASKQNTLSIGGYSEALEKAGVKSGGVINGFLGMAKAAWAFVATPIGAILAAIVVVVTAIYNVFKNFQPVVDWFAQKIAAVTAIFNVFKNALLGWLSGQKSFTESFANLGDAMSEAAKRAIELKKAQQELEDQQDIAVESQAKYKRQIDELLLQSKNRTLSEQERMALIDKALKIEEEAYNKKKQMADDEYNQKVEEIAINNQLTEEQKKNLKEQGAAYLQKLQETKAINDDEVKAFAELSAKREDILDESISIREKAMNRSDALADKIQQNEEKRQAKIKEAQDKETERLNKLNEKRLADAEKYRQIEEKAEEVIADVKEKQRREAAKKEQDERKAAREYERNRLAEDLQLQYDIRVLSGENEFALQRDQLAKKEQQELDAAKKSGASVELIKKKYLLSQMAIDKAEFTNKLQLLSEFSGNLSTIFGKSTAIGKAASSAQVTIDTIRGAQAAIASTAGAGPFGWILGIAKAAAITASGIKGVRDIWAVKSGLSGDTGGGSSSGVSSSGVNSSIGQGIVSQNVNNTNNQTRIVNQPTLVTDAVTQAQQAEDRRNDTSMI